MVPTQGGPAPFVAFHPGVRFGCPHIRGVPLETLIDSLRAEKNGAVVCNEYDVTRAELVMACWFAARWGLPNATATRLVPVAAWKDWLARYGDALWRGELDMVDLPTEMGA